MTETFPACPVPSQGLLVVCLCAEWCGVCRDYRSRFAQVQASILVEHPQARFLWLDVEDEADLLDPLDIENFPTLLLAVGALPCFFGPMTPQAATLERMVQTVLGNPAAHTLGDPAVLALTARILAEKQVG